jgi:SAM-dependent methyltransferase
VNPAFAGRYGEFERWHWWFRGREEILTAVLRRELSGSAGRVIVSVGCGPVEGLGWLAAIAGPRGRVVGVDADATHGRAVGTTRVVVGRIEAPPLRAGIADAVVALDVLEHVEDDAGALAAAARLVRPGGLVLVTVPALQALWGRQDVVSHHRRRYSRALLRRTFAAAGLPAPRATYFNTLLLPPVAAIRLLRRVAGREGGERSDFDDGRPGVVNDLLRRVFAAERHLVSRISLPLGVSLLATARPATPGSSTGTTPG